MFPYLLLLFTVVPAIELIVIIEVGSHIGSVNTLLVIILTGILGATLARVQGFVTLQKIQSELNRGQMPSDQLIDGLMILVGGVVLLTPGFITDTIGFVLLIPWTRSLIKAWLSTRFERALRNGKVVNMSFSQPKNDHYDDIDI